MQIERLEALQQRLDRFYGERDWRRFQGLKDLAASLTIEAGELQELFLWRDDEQRILRERRADMAGEVSDILINLLNFARVARIDLLAVCEQKLEELEARYPASEVRSRVVGKGARR